MHFHAKFLSNVVVALALLAVVTEATGVGRIGAPTPSWVSDKWTTPSGQYVSERKNLFDRILKRDGVLALQARLDGLSKRNPRNSLDQFRWAFLTYHAAAAGLLDWHPKEFSARLSGFAADAVSRMARANRPNCREYSRLLFIVAWTRQHDRWLLDLGARLWNTDRNDRQVAFMYADLLFDTDELPLTRKGVAIADRLSSKDPKSWQYALLSGRGHYYIWFATKSASEKTTAKNLFAKVRALAPREQKNAADPWEKVLDGKL